MKHAILAFVFFLWFTSMVLATMIGSMLAERL
jgi:hypothetical protein